MSIKHDWRDNRGKWPLARNPDRSWWYRHTSIKLVGRSPLLHVPTRPDTVQEENKVDNANYEYIERVYTSSIFTHIIVGSLHV